MAALDIGSNTVRLLAAQVLPDGSFQEIFEDSVITRLAQDVDRSGILAAEAVQRTLDVLKEFRAVCDRLKVRKIAAIGTSALRDGANRDAFLVPAANLGFNVEVAAGRREAELTWRGVAMARMGEGGPRLMIDVGGGSTEIVIALPDRPPSYASLQAGSVRMTERHLRSDPPSPEQVEAVRKDVMGLLQALDVPEGFDGPFALAVAGTATSLARFCLRDDRYVPERIHGFRLDLPRLDSALEEMTAATVEERKRWPWMDPKRAEVLPGGAVVLQTVCRFFNIGAVTVCLNDNRHGLIAEAIEKSQ